jgi:hypothetical protein
MKKYLFFFTLVSMETIPVKGFNFSKSKTYSTLAEVLRSALGAWAVPSMLRCKRKLRLVAV